MNEIIERKQGNSTSDSDSSALITLAFLVTLKYGIIHCNSYNQSIVFPAGCIQTNGFLPSTYWWEIVNFGRKVAILLIPIIFNNQPENQVHVF